MNVAIRVLLLLEAATFVVAAVLHLGVALPLGFATLQEPRILPATIVEGLCGLFLALSACAIFTRKTWGRRCAISAHLFAIAGVLLGMAALALGRGPRTETNDIYHRVMLVALAAGLILLMSPAGKAALSGERG